jgi:hypothetical protein
MHNIINDLIQERDLLSQKLNSVLATRYKIGSDDLRCKIESINVEIHKLQGLLVLSL